MSDPSSPLHPDTRMVRGAADHIGDGNPVSVPIHQTTIYGAMPARLSLQEDYFDNYTETNFPEKDDINWDVVVASMAYPDNPNHESYMPSYQETQERYNQFWSKLADNPGLDVDEEIEILLEDLQQIFDAVSEN